jgi:putative hydrolase of the HAD superfamily
MQPKRTKKGRFTQAVHDIRLDDCITPDPSLRKMLSTIDLSVCSPWVYTASVSDHAERCLAALGIADVLPNRPVIDVRQVGYTTK